MEDTNRLLPEGTLLRNDTYRIEQSLGSGGFGNTYLVRHIGLDAKMVVKEFFMKGISIIRYSDGSRRKVMVQSVCRVCENKS